MDPVVLTARALLLALTMVLVGVVGHLAAGGADPSAGAIVLLAAGAFVLCLATLRAPAGLLRITALLVGGQLLTHLTLSLGAAASGGGTNRAAAGALALPVNGGRRVGSLQDSHDIATGHAHQASVQVDQLVGSLPGHAPMMTAHLLAALALGLGLFLGERCLWTLVALLSGVVLRLLEPVRVAVSRTPSTLAPAPTRPPHLLTLLAPIVVRRGPPAALGAA